MRCELSYRIVLLAKHKAIIKNSVLRIILNNTSSIWKTSVIVPKERLNPKIFNPVSTSLTMLFIPNKLLSRQGESFDYVLAYLMDITMEKCDKKRQLILFVASNISLPHLSI